MLTYIFPGQGSQFKGMGSNLFDAFKDLTAKADDVLGYSIKQFCTEDTHSQLNQTQFTQPALFVINAFTYLSQIRETGKKPDFVAGHSLGEYNALFAAGAFDFETGLRLVKKRGELMGLVTGGGMAAVVGLQKEQVAKVLEANGLDGIDVANYNTPSQIVISGRSAEIEKAKSIFEATTGVEMFAILKVSGAFHSRYMSEAQKEFERYLASFHFLPLSIPVISNIDARPYENEKLRETLAKQISSPVRWVESVRYLLKQGEMQFEEIGPGRVLTGMIQKIMQDTDPHDEVETTLEPTSTASPELADTKFVYPAVTASSLGSSEFKKEYNLKYAYLAGGMYRGIASQEMVVRLAKSGLMGFLGTGGMSMRQVEENILYIQSQVSPGQAYGVNLVHNWKNPESDNSLIELLLQMNVQHLEAAAFLNVTSSLVRFRAKSLFRDASGEVIARNKIIAKVSRPEVAEAFLSPAPDLILQDLVEKHLITQQEAELARELPMADDICVEADSAGHTDSGVAYTLMPAMLRLRDEMMAKYRYRKKVRVGSAGGIGTPEAALAAFMLGADFILTGSINQCTVEAGTSEKVKDLLQQMNVQDTDYAPAGDMFEMGSKVQVLRKGVFFPARANKLYEIYRRYNSLDEIDSSTSEQIQNKYFKRSFEQIYEELKVRYPNEINKAEQNPKHKMAMVFKWYFGYSSRLALSGSAESTVDYQIHCGPALGAFNQWVKGTELENWRNRHVDEIGERLMIATAELINRKFASLLLPAEGKIPAPV
ncbi:Polyketide biosynthesis protein PksE [compost metagenome]